VLLAVTIAAAIGLMAWRAPYLRAEHDFESFLSRESALIVNNYLFVAIALVVLGGTLFPVFSELFAAGQRVTVGPPFFNRVVGPLLVGLVGLIAIGTVLPWRRASTTTLMRRARVPLFAAVLASMVLSLAGMRDPFALAATVAAVVLAVVTVREFALGARGARAAGAGPWPAALTSLFARDPRRYGGYLVHLGIAVMAVAVAGSTIYQQQLRTTVAPGGSFEAGGRTLTYDGLRERTGVANGVQREIIAPLTVTRDGEELGRLTPGRRQFTNFPSQPTAIVDLDSIWRDDLYVFVQGWDDEGVAEFHVFVNPLIAWLWIGAAVYVAGGVLAWAPLAAPASVAARVGEAAPAASASP
jgi:cytochrome c-type biogenesis protein CcmF